MGSAGDVAQIVSSRQVDRASSVGPRLFRRSSRSCSRREGAYGPACVPGLDETDNPLNKLTATRRAATHSRLANDKSGLCCPGCNPANEKERLSAPY